MRFFVTESRQLRAVVGLPGAAAVHGDEEKERDLLKRGVSSSLSDSGNRGCDLSRGSHWLSDHPVRAFSWVT